MLAQFVELGRTDLSPIFNKNKPPKDWCEICTGAAPNIKGYCAA
jgi:hypothetical protein